ncbi:hypothetical protein B0T17DRAFT_586024 [Bombardia bombarda]|uniref:NAD(P)-binding protein n=1 Tax=Bombardia bombarda TaxID=252184 RepID=A0AA39TG94_9PEZI|nr:hypothetical protein B0T17DRAFT_586024 [Bombardia bombarda]
MSGETYLITGVNRGIGRGLFDLYVAQANNIVIAAVRNIEGAQGLLSAPRGDKTQVLLAKINSASRTDPFQAVKVLEGQGVDHIDVVISSAGMVKMITIENLPLEEFEEVLQVNAFSVILLYQATLPLLRKAVAPVRFAFISAAGGNAWLPYPNISYAGFKALANVAVIKMGMENDWLITLCIHPGLVQTDMGNEGARTFGLPEAPITLEASSKNTAYIVTITICSS